MFLKFICFAFILIWIFLVIINKKNIKNITLSFFVIFILLYLRLRDRLPLEIHFDSIFFLIIGILIISIHSFILFSDFLPKNPNPVILNIFSKLVYIYEKITNNLILTIEKFFIYSQIFIISIKIFKMVYTI